MDPNETLKEIRQAIKESENISMAEAYIILDDMAMRFEELDLWITRGGFLPDDWKET